MAKKLTEKQELLQFYRELMTDEHMTVSRFNEVTYKIVRKDGTSSKFSFVRPYDVGEEAPADWEEPTPEIIVAKIMKKCKPRTFTQNELNATAFETQAKMVWIGEHSDLIPYLLEYAKTDRETFSCFREFIYWTELRKTNYTKNFAQWWRETFPKYEVKYPQNVEDVAQFDRFVIDSLPVAWLPDGYDLKRKSETKPLDLFSFLDDEVTNDYADKPRRIWLDDAIKSKQVFWMRVRHDNNASPRRIWYTISMVTPIEDGMFEVQPLGKTKLGTPFSKNKITEKDLRTYHCHDWCSLQELHFTNTEFLL